jgi:carnitine O-acetyltransferase
MIWADPRQFNFSRIPLPGSDAFSAIAPKATHLTVMIDDFIYSIEVFTPAGEDGIPQPLSASDIAKNIRGVVDDARTRRRQGEEAVRLGILTADERDTWTQVGWTGRMRLTFRKGRNCSLSLLRTENR